VAAALTVALAGRGRARALLRPRSGSRQEQAELNLAALVLFAPRVSVAEAVTQVDASDFAEQHQLQACCRPRLHWMMLFWAAVLLLLLLLPLPPPSCSSSSSSSSSSSASFTATRMHRIALWPTNLHALPSVRS